VKISKISLKVKAFGSKVFRELQSESFFNISAAGRTAFLKHGISNPDAEHAGLLIESIGVDYLQEYDCSFVYQDCESLYSLVVLAYFDIFLSKASFF